MYRSDLSCTAYSSVLCSLGMYRIRFENHLVKKSQREHLWSCSTGGQLMATPVLQAHWAVHSAEQQQWVKEQCLPVGVHAGVANTLCFIYIR